MGETVLILGRAMFVDGMGDEVVLFGAGSIILVCLLYKTMKFLSDTQDNSQDSFTSHVNGPERTMSPDCAICLGETRFAVQTNCGHIYCGDCIFEVWRRTNQLNATNCPYCRQRITLILTHFSREERNSTEPADVDLRNGILHNIHTYNRRYSGEPRSFTETIRDAPTLASHLFSRLFSGEDGFTFAFQLRIIVLVLVWFLYLLSPLDLIPEAVFGFVGLLDDIVIFLFLTMYLTTIFRAVMTQLGHDFPVGLDS